MWSTLFHGIHFMKLFFTSTLVTNSSNASTSFSAHQSDSLGRIPQEYQEGQGTSPFCPPASGVLVLKRLPPTLWHGTFSKTSWLCYVKADSKTDNADAQRKDWYIIEKAKQMKGATRFSIARDMDIPETSPTQEFIFDVGGSADSVSFRNSIWN